MLNDSVYLGRDTEGTAIATRDAVIRALLRRGVDVVCDDTNLRTRNVRDLQLIADATGAAWEIVDLTDELVDECIERDAARPKPVGETVIRDMFDRFIRGRSHPLPLPQHVEIAGSTAESYTPPDGKPSAVLVDVDGTVALMNGRSPYDETRVHEDWPNPPVVAAVRAMAAGHLVVFCSGRTEASRDATERWLAEHVAVPVEALHMRPVGDTRKDAVVKAELFDQHIRHNYRVVAVFDDRAQVVAMWRSLGLTVFQVAEGAF